MQALSRRGNGTKLIDKERIQEAIAAIICAIGEDPDREGLADTPRRVARMYEEFFSGLDEDPAEVLATGFEEDHREIVVLKDIPFVSMCEHHFLPFFGHAHVGYIPSGRVVGASKLARALDILARRPQIQERLTNQFVDVVFKSVQPEGVAAILNAEHMGLSLRGAKKPGTKIATSASRGSLKTRPSAKQEFLNLLQGP